MSASKGCVAIAPLAESEPAVRELKRGLGHLAYTVRRWQARAKQRRELKALLHDADFLQDIGVSAGDAMREANKPFWEE